MFRFGIGVASPSISLSTPAMMRIRVDLPEPFRPSRPILAPGKNDSEMSFRIWRLGGTILPTRFMVKTYWAICGFGCLEDCGFRFYGGLRPGGGRSLSLRREAPGFSRRRCVSRSAQEVTTLYFDGYGCLRGDYLLWCRCRVFSAVLSARLRLRHGANTCRCDGG